MYRILSYEKRVNGDLVDSLGRSLLQLSMCEMQWENIRIAISNDNCMIMQKSWEVGLIIDSSMFIIAIPNVSKVIIV